MSEELHWRTHTPRSNDTKNDTIFDHIIWKDESKFAMVGRRKFTLTSPDSKHRTKKLFTGTGQMHMIISIIPQVPVLAS